jgi:hypothetical protein
MSQMKMLLIAAAVATLSFAGVAFAGEGYDPSQFAGVPPGFNDGTTQGMQTQRLATYFQNQAEQTARAQQTGPNVASTPVEQNGG